MINDVYVKYIELDGSPDKSLVSSKHYMMEKLHVKYRDTLYFTSQERRTNIFFLKIRPTASFLNIIT